MNQILYTNKKNNSSIENKIKTNVLKLQFIGSIILFLITIIIYFFNITIINNKENASNQIKSNYSISRLYSNNGNLVDNKVYTKNGSVFTVIGMIEIPKINIYYPIISESNDELLKISPCRISGPMPNEDGNLCIAGHNYNNYKFFSKVSSLTNNDNIIIHSMNGSKLAYKVFKVYEVNANDLSPLENSDNIKKQVTLVTCNNLNSSTRIIIKASVV